MGIQQTGKFRGEGWRVAGSTMQSANPSVSIKNADSRIYANSAKSHIQPQSAKDRESLQNVVGHSRETNKQKLRTQRIILLYIHI